MTKYDHIWSPLAPSPEPSSSPQTGIIVGAVVGVLVAAQNEWRVIINPDVAASSTTYTADWAATSKFAVDCSGVCSQIEAADDVLFSDDERESAEAPRALALSAGGGGALAAAAWRGVASSPPIAVRHLLIHSVLHRIHVKCEQ